MRRFYLVGGVTVAMVLLMIPVICLAVEVWESWTPTGSIRAVLARDDHVWAVGPGAVVCWDKAGRCYDTWTRYDGLGDATYTSILEDPDGAVWFGSPGLVSRFYDGEFLNYVLPGACGKHLAIDWQGRIWAGGGQADQSDIAVFNGLGWETWHLSDSLWAMKSGPDGSIWISSRSCLNRISSCGSKMYYYPDSHSQIWGFKTLAIAPDGIVWGTPGSLIYQLDPSGETPAWTVYGSLNEGCPPFAMYPPHDSCVDDQGALWFAVGNLTIEGSGEEQCALLKWTPGDEIPQIYGNDELAASAVSLSIDPMDGSLWIASLRMGTNRFDGSNFECWDTSEEVHYPIVTGGLDERKNMWFGTGGAASLGKYSRDSGFEWGWKWGRWPGGTYFQYPFMPLAPGWPSSVYDLVIDSSDNKWFICEYWGLYRLNDHSLTSWDRTNSLLSATFDARIEVDAQGAIWVGYTDALGWGEANRFNDEGWEKISFETIGVNGIYDIEAEPYGAVWFCGISAQETEYDPARAGLSRFDDGEWTHFNLYDPPLNASVGYSMELDDWGNLWLGTDAGLRSFNGKEWSIYDHGDGSNPPGPIRCVSTDGLGRIWCANGETSAWVFDGADWSVYTIDNSPLVSGSIKDIIVGEDGEIWFATKNGTSRMREPIGEVELSIGTETNYGNDAARMSLLASCSNEIDDLFADLIVWVELDDCSKLYLPCLSMNEQPIFGNMSIPYGFDGQDLNIFEIDLSNIPHGRYMIKALLTNHGCIESALSNEAITEFNW